MTVAMHNLPQQKIILQRAFPWKPVVLLSPLLCLLILTLVVPMGLLIWRSVAEPELVNALPATQPLLRHWDGRGLPSGKLQEALITDLKNASPVAVASLGRRLTYDTPGMRPLLFRTRARLLNLPPPVLPSVLAGIDPLWASPDTWQTLKRAAGPVSSFYLLSALDLRYSYTKGIESRAEAGLYRSILQRTFSIALITTFCCLVLAFPLCATVNRLSEKARKRMMILILIPFWTSILVRTTAWMVLLQDHGVINDFLAATGITDSPLHLLYNRTGVLIALIHVMLPFMIFPLLASMSSADPRLTRAAASLGASPLTIFFRVWLPQIMPGIVAGVLMVFIVTLGFYITPALIGGPADQMISYYIALFTTGTMNWGLASALGMILTIVTCLLYLLQRQLTDRQNKGGH